MDLSRIKPMGRHIGQYSNTSNIFETFIFVLNFENLSVGV